MLSDSEEWDEARQKAGQANNWFTPGFTLHATQAIATQYLQAEKLQDFAVRYKLPAVNTRPRTVGLVMAGNIPLVGFHDWLCVFLTGHRMMIKVSSKDDVLIKHLIAQLAQWDSRIPEQMVFADLLKGCDAYIATGSNNTARYFEYYFQKYPSIIRKNRTSVAVLTGKEEEEHLQQLADDVYMYFGLGCRNVTKLYVPRNYDFVPLLEAFRKYDYLIHHHKYKNNYDYQLAISLLNKQYYMTNGSILVLENQALFSPISQLNYEYYDDEAVLFETLQQDAAIQCVVGSSYVPFGSAQMPALTDFADGVDTIHFLLGLQDRAVVEQSSGG